MILPVIPIFKILLNQGGGIDVVRHVLHVFRRIGGVVLLQQAKIYGLAKIKRLVPGFLALSFLRKTRGGGISTRH